MGYWHKSETAERRVGSLTTAAILMVIPTQGRAYLTSDPLPIYAAGRNPGPEGTEGRRRMGQVLGKEKELRQALGEIRQAIAEYKNACDEGLVGPLDRKVEDECYPPTLETLVEGVRPPNKAYRMQFLRRIPVDPVIGGQEWGLRSAQDERDAETWGGQNVFNVYSRSEGLASDGTRYRDW